MDEITNKNKARSSAGRVLKLDINQCPITRGLPTRMTLKGFKLCCEKQTRNRVEQRNFNYKQYETTIFDIHCKNCKGKIPSEITIITIPGVSEYTPEVIVKPRRKHRKTKK
jgi:hypothetical protein